MKQFIAHIIGFLASAILFTTACTDDNPVGGKGIQPTRIALTDTVLELYNGTKGSTYQFHITLYPAEADTPKLKWEILPESTIECTITQTGLLEIPPADSMTEGYIWVKVLALSEGGEENPDLFSALYIDVHPLRGTLSFGEDTLLSVRTYEKKVFPFILEPADAVIPKHEVSVVPEIALIHEGEGSSFVIEGLRPGKAVLWYKGKIVDIEVKGVAVTGILVEDLSGHTSATGQTGDRIYLKALLQPEYATLRKVEWSATPNKAGHPVVAFTQSTDDGAEILLVDSGTCVITATSFDGRYTGTYEVTSEISYADLTVFLEQSVHGTYYYTDRTYYSRYYVSPPYRNATILLRTSDEQIVTLEEISPYNGKNIRLSPHREGEAYLYATVAENGYKDSAAVRVIHYSCENITAELKIYAETIPVTYQYEIYNGNQKKIEDIAVEITTQLGEKYTFTHAEVNYKEKATFSGYIVSPDASTLLGDKVASFSYTFKGERVHYFKPKDHR
jgi:hypothetical protein